MAGQEGMQPMNPMNPAGGGGSKVHTGPAGEAGNVTSPMASRKLDLTKIAKLLHNRKRSFPEFVEPEKKTLRIGFRLKNRQTDNLGTN